MNVGCNLSRSASSVPRRHGAIFALTSQVAPPFTSTSASIRPLQWMTLTAMHVGLYAIVQGILCQSVKSRAVRLVSLLLGYILHIIMMMMTMMMTMIVTRGWCIATIRSKCRLQNQHSNTPTWYCIVRLVYYWRTMLV